MTALNRLLSSFPFRLTLAYMGVFVLAAVLIVSFIAWRANELLTTKVIETLTAEVVGLREQFQVGGPARLRTAGETALSRYLSARIGNATRLLVERSDGGEAFGHNDHFAPVRLVHEAPAGAILEARVTAATHDHLIAAAA